MIRSFARPLTSQTRRNVNKKGTDSSDIDLVLESSRINSQLSNRNNILSSNKKTHFSKIPTTIRSNMVSDIPIKGVSHDNDSKKSYFLASDEERKQNPQLTFDLLKTMTPKNCIKYLDNNPLFLKSLVVNGVLDTEMVSLVSLTLTPSELQRYMMNMTSESNIYSMIVSCRSISDFETQICDVLPIKEAIIWNRIGSSSFLHSDKLKKVIPEQSLNFSCVAQ